MAGIIRSDSRTVNGVGRHYTPFQAKRSEKTKQFHWAVAGNPANFPGSLAESLKSG